MTIIFLNGCTSAGKTSLARTLQAMLPGSWLRIGIDDGFAMLAERFHSTVDGCWFDTDPYGHVRLNLGPEGARALAAYRHAAVAMAGSGADMIVDEVLLSQAIADDWQGLFGTLPVLKVGVHCDLLTLERRERARGDRAIGQARGQFRHVHSYMAYDLEVDAGTASPADCAARIADWLAAR